MDGEVEMIGSMSHIVRGYLDNLQVSLQAAQYTKVPVNWGTAIQNPDVTRAYFFREGQGSIEINHRTYLPQPGQLFILPAGQNVRFDTSPDNTFGKYWCHLSAEVGDVNLFRLISVPHCVTVKDEPALEQLFLRMIACDQDHALASVLTIKSCLLELLAVFFDLAAADGYDIRPNASADTHHIQVLLEYIDEHLATRITLAKLADLVHFHPQYLVLYFKAALGVSPIAYVNRKRIEQARQMLTTVDMSVTEVAHAVGMEPYYFSRMFKKQIGFSPRDYRANIQGTGA